MSEVMYCLTHEEYGVPELDGLDECIWTDSPAPEFEMTDEWVASLTHPTDDELLVMYLNSLELEFDIIGD